MPVTDPSDTEVLTVEEAAGILRIGRNAAYALARQWRASGGRQGLPCIELGRSLRVPRAARNSCSTPRPSTLVEERTATTPPDTVPGSSIRKGVKPRVRVTPWALTSCCRGPRRA